jgi:hypothetical protein
MYLARKAHRSLCLCNARTTISLALSLAAAFALAHAPITVHRAALKVYTAWLHRLAPRAQQEPHPAFNEWM